MEYPDQNKSPLLWLVTTTTFYPPLLWKNIDNLKQKEPHNPTNTTTFLAAS